MSASSLSLAADRLSAGEAPAVFEASQGFGSVVQQATGNTQHALVIPRAGYHTSASIGAGVVFGAAHCALLRRLNSRSET